MATKAPIPLHVWLANKWRDSLNPLRSITMSRVVTYLEAGERGEYADLQWLYRTIEKRDATLRALIELRESAMGKLDWNIKAIPAEEMPGGATEKMAETQAQALRAEYEKIDNLNEAISNLALASFRGFTHLEKHYMPDWSVKHLEFVDQWYFVREGLKGPWRYDKDARNDTTSSVPIETEHWIVREEKRPINEVALIAFMRKNLSQKDWDGFVETYGIPPFFITMPENVPTEKQAEYQELAEAVIGDMRGTLPSGSDVKTVDAGARNHPFENHIKYQDQQLVLAGTSGKLKMLAESGSGTLAGGAHSDTFDAIAEAEAKSISEVMQKQFDAAILDRLFPGQPHLVYFELAAPDEEDVDKVVEHAGTLRQAGYAIDREDLEERTGYRLTEAPVGPTTEQLIKSRSQGSRPAPRASSGRGGPGSCRPGSPSLHNRDLGVGIAAEVLAAKPLAQAAQVAEVLAAKSLDAVARSQAELLAPIRDRIAGIMEIADDQFRANALRNLRNELPGLLAKMNIAPATAGVIENSLGAALINGYAEGVVKRSEVAA